MYMGRSGANGRTYVYARVQHENENSVVWSRRSYSFFLHGRAPVGSRSGGHWTLRYLMDVLVPVPLFIGYFVLFFEKLGTAGSLGSLYIRLFCLFTGF